MINTINHQMLQMSGQTAAKTTFSRIAGFALFIAAALLSSSICSASVANIYVAQNAAGSANGADCADALAISWVNTTGNWGGGANQIGPGSTIHLCGTFTGAANDKLLSFQGSGTSGNPITLKFEPNAVVTAPYWNFFGAISANGKSWITIDGGSNGVIQNSDNGSAGTFNNAAGSVPIYVFGPASNITIKNLTIANICQHTSIDDHIGCQTGGNGDAGIWLQNGLSNVTVTNNTIHDASTGIVYLANTGDTAVTLSSNTISRTNWGMGLASIGISSGLTVTGNDISCVVAAPCNWNDGATNNFHHNGMIIFPQGAGDQMQNMVISNNYIHDINTCTGGIFLDPAAGDIPGVQIYNNVFFTTPGQIGPSNAWVTVGIGNTNALVANNTIIGPGGEGIGASASPTIKNNIIAGTYWGEVLNSGYVGVSSDYNIWYNLNPGDSMNAGGLPYATVSDWVAATGFDVHSLTSNPSLTAGFVPGATSPAIGKGLNLTSLGISGLNISAPQKFGVGGSCGTGCVPRPSTGSWDIGAYQHSSTPGAPVAPATGLTGTAH